MSYDQKSYQAWRSTIPFTDEQFAVEHERIAAVYERDGNQWTAQHHRWRAERCRKGFVRGSDLRVCLDALIKTCGVCGKKALYRNGSEGRCSEHRLVPVKAHAERIARKERGWDEYGKEKKRREALLDAHRRFHDGSAVGQRLRRRT